MEITFKQAQQALAHLRKKQLPNGQQQIPELMKVKGKPGIKIYQIKCDLEDAFKAEIERFQDLSRQAQSVDDDTDLQELDNEAVEMLKEKKDVTLSSGKLKASEIEDVLDANILSDLDFLIDIDNE